MVRFGTRKIRISAKKVDWSLTQETKAEGPKPSALVL